MKAILKEWVEDILKDELVVGNIADETASNYWSFSFPENEGILGGDIKNFFEYIYREQSKKIEEPMLFYVWYDEMSHHLCYCIASVTEDTLPFKSTVLLKSNIEDIINLYLNPSSETYIPFDDLTPVPIEEAFPNGEYVCDEVKGYQVSVWCKKFHSH